MMEVRKENGGWLLSIILLLLVRSDIDRREISVTAERLAALVIVQGDLTVELQQLGHAVGLRGWSFKLVRCYHAVHSCLHGV